jgi:hypothetical protein
MWGMAWYSPSMFGNKWMQYHKLSTERVIQMSNEKSTHGKSFAIALLQSFILSQLVDSNIILTLGIVFVLWLGFVMPTQFTDILYSESDQKLIFIDAGFQLVTLSTAALILSLWPF